MSAVKKALVWKLRSEVWLPYRQHIVVVHLKVLITFGGSDSFSIHICHLQGDDGEKPSAPELDDAGTHLSSES